MNAFFTYIFKHKHYKEVIAIFEQATTKYIDAFKIWCEKVGLNEYESYSSKEFISSSFEKIKEVSKWLGTYNRIKNTQREALLWIFQEKGLSSIPTLKYDEYQFIHDEIHRIGVIQGYINTYEALKRDNIEAINRFLSVSKTSHTNDEIQRIALSKDEIYRISKTLNNAHSCELKYKDAWKVFSKGRSFENIPLTELQTIKKDSFETKDQFLRIYDKDSNLISLILGNTMLPVDSFDKEAIEQEEDIVVILASRNLEPIEPFQANIHVDNEKELKRAILDSVRYGDDCNFAATFTIAKFYSLRSEFDVIGVQFDDAVKKVKSNYDAIKAYNSANSGENKVFIEDYLRSVSERSPLYQYIEVYQNEKRQRDEAKRIKSNYPKGFNTIFGTLDLDTCSLQYVQSVIDSRERIVNKENELNKIERQRIEAERRRQEEIQKRQELRDLKSCVSTWPQPSRSSVDCFSLYYYYPTTCPWDASEDEWDVRNLIWDFKANPNRPQSLTEITNRHQRAMNEVIPDLKRVLRRYFGSKVSKLTLVCIPSSKRIVSERRYKDFSEQLCNETGITNGYSHVHIAEEGDAAHLGGVVQAQFSVDGSFFKDKYVILFDDVITSGRSMERFKRLLESAGANVIGGLSIGKTKHERQGSNPIDQI